MFSFNVLDRHIAIPFLLPKLLLGNCAPGAIALIFAFFDGKQRLRQLTSTLLHWRAPVKYYAYACALPPAIFYTSLALTRLYFPSSFLLLSPRRFFLELVLTLPFGPLWEEVAWRAYALRELQVHYTELKSALVIGLFWFTWHIPLWWLTLGLNRTTALPVLGAAFISILSLSFIFASLYHRTGLSLPVMILLHAVYTSAADNISVNVRTGQLEYIGLSALLFACVASAVARGMRRPQAVETRGPTGR